MRQGSPTAAVQLGYLFLEGPDHGLDQHILEAQLDLAHSPDSDRSWSERAVLCFAHAAAMGNSEALYLMGWAAHKGLTDTPPPTLVLARGEEEEDKGEGGRAGGAGAGSGGEVLPEGQQGHGSSTAGDSWASGEAPHAGSDAAGGQGPAREILVEGAQHMAADPSSTPAEAAAVPARPLTQAEEQLRRTQLARAYFTRAVQAAELSGLAGRSVAPRCALAALAVDAWLAPMVGPGACERVGAWLLHWVHLLAGSSPGAGGRAAEGGLGRAGSPDPMPPSSSLQGEGQQHLGQQNQGVGGADWWRQLRAHVCEPEDMAFVLVAGMLVAVRLVQRRRIQQGRPAAVLAEGSAGGSLSAAAG